jgi:flagellar hook assembly protein FlgD
LDYNSFNPTNQTLGMDVRVDVAGEVKVIVCNMAGTEVRKILDTNLGVGNSRAVWDGKNSSGGLVGNGVYFVLIQTPSTKLVQKVIVLR